MKHSLLTRYSSMRPIAGLIFITLTLLSTSKAFAGFSAEGACLETCAETLAYWNSTFWAGGTHYNPPDGYTYVLVSDQIIDSASCAISWTYYGFSPQGQRSPPADNVGGSGTFVPCTNPCPAGPAGQSVAQCKPQKDSGNPSCKQGSSPYPIDGGTGSKYWSDIDYASAGVSGLRFRREYNSLNTGAAGTLATAWHHNYDSAITTGLAINGTAVVFMARPNGASYSFVLSGSNYVSQDGDVTDKLTRIVDTGGNTTGWKYAVVTDNSIENYDVAGKLLSISNRVGLVQSLTYSNASTPSTIAPQSGLLLRVIDNFGFQLNFTYDSSRRINKMTDPAGGQYLYSYDANNNLLSITYPDGKIKAYLYNEAAYTSNTNFPNALTGVMDENNVRYASYYYNAQGKAISGQHAGGVDQYQLTYSSDGSSSTITDPFGTTRTTTFATILGAMKATGQSQPGGSGCSPASSAVTYDANGNVASRTDFNGVKTTYQYDLTRNLETSRVEATGTPQARTITTTWHATYRLPSAIAEPLRKTTLTYDASGNLLTKTVQTTADTTGTQGISAAAVGAVPTWAYTYNNVGQVLTVTGPRTDVIDLTTYTYDASGNLVTVANAAGHVTTLSNYDANGRVGRIVDANGVTTDLTYSARGWLLSKVVTGAGGTPETTSYQYDGVGQLTQVSLPDGSSISYTYDPAHRLTNIADSLGNSIAYMLDAMGNRINEQIKDPSGTLARQTTRVFDALNRLQQITGGV